MLNQSFKEPSDEEIQQKAYEIYLRRGEASGNELDDWFEAKRQLSQTAAPQAESVSAQTPVREERRAVTPETQSRRARVGSSS